MVDSGSGAIEIPKDYHHKFTHELNGEIRQFRESLPVGITRD
jgi:hypothetical protein